MADDLTISDLLAQLDGIANAPMTAEQRRMRAKPLLDAAALSVTDLAGALARPGLPWNQRKAQQFGMPVVAWLEALSVVELPASHSLGELLDRIHRAEAAASLLEAGYTAARDPSGHLTWSRR